ncbi:MAG: methyltransferase [Saprospiraceae bacterium]|nr:methyltransferase [Saprospiraceae bacterium]MDW8484299.1 methyltransferase [Saprospiraceae bacterium]
MEQTVFRCKSFEIRQCSGVHPVGTDGILLGAWASLEGVKYALDVGTGTGLLALMLAHRSAEIEVHCIDIQEKARQCAAENFRASPWADRLRIVGSDLQTYSLEAVQQYDLVISNPPFYTENVRSPKGCRLQNRHASSLPPDLLVRVARHLLKPTGKLCAIMPPTTAQTLVERGATHGLYLTRLTEVFSRPQKKGPERWLIQLEHNPYLFEHSQLRLYTSEGAYAEAYRALTADFLLWAENTSPNV